MKRFLFSLLLFLSLDSFSEFTQLDSGHLEALVLDVGATEVHTREIYNKLYSWHPFSYSDLATIESCLSSLVNYRDTLNVYLGQYSNFLGDLKTNVRSLSDFDFATESTLSAIQQILSTSASEHTLSEVDNKLASLLSDMSSLSSNVSTLSKEETLSSVNSKLDNLSKEETLSSVNSKLDNLSKEETLSSVNLKLDSLAKEETLSSIKSRVYDLATEETLSSVDSKLDGLQSVSDYFSSGEVYKKSDWKIFLDSFKTTIPVPQPANSGFYAYTTSAQVGSHSTQRTGSHTYGNFFESLLHHLVDQYSAFRFHNNSTILFYDFLHDYLVNRQDQDDWDDFRERYLGLFETSFTADNNTYASIEFPSNSSPTQVDLSYSGMDFFNASLKLLSDGNKINASTTMFLKHIRERLPDLKSKDTKEDEDRIDQSISDTSSQLDSLKQSFEFSEISFKDSSQFFDGDSILSELKNSYCPHAIILRIPEFMGMPEYVVSVLVSDIQPFLDVSRAVFGCVYFVLIAGFVWFVFRLFIPVLSRFSKLLATVLNW